MSAQHKQEKGHAARVATSDTFGELGKIIDDLSETTNLVRAAFMACHEAEDFVRDALAALLGTIEDNLEDLDDRLTKIFKAQHARGVAARSIESSAGA